MKLKPRLLMANIRKNQYLSLNQTCVLLESNLSL